MNVPLFKRALAGAERSQSQGPSCRPIARAGSQKIEIDNEIAVGRRDRAQCEIDPNDLHLKLASIQTYPRGSS
jgi:hypothetical protein